MNDYNCVINAAFPSEAEDIYALKIGALGKHLIYTIYQAPQSAVYLQELLTQGADSTEHFFFVAKHNNELVGYYHARRHISAFFLNYIVVEERARNRGVGNKLLKHYESIAETLSCNTLELDVFESNASAYQWYCKAGYSPLTVRNVASIELGWKGVSQYALNFESTDWHLARQEERNRGFSKIECLCGPGRLTLGLIAGHVCKLLSFDGILLEDAIAAINDRFSGTHDKLIVMPPRMLANLPCVASETIIKFSKCICKL